MFSPEHAKRERAKMGAVAAAITVGLVLVVLSVFDVFGIQQRIASEEAREVVGIGLCAMAAQNDERATSIETEEDVTQERLDVAEQTRESAGRMRDAAREVFGVNCDNYVNGGDSP